MGLVRVVGERRGGGADIKREGSNLKLTENYVFLVEAQLPNESRIVILGARDLPIVGITVTLYGAVCTSKSAVRSKENTHFWEVTCIFETGAVKQEGTGNPNEWFPVFELSFETQDVPSPVDVNGKRYVNSAGDDFDDDITLKKKFISINFFQYENINLTEVAISDRGSTVNKTKFAGYEKHTLLLSINKAARGFIGGVGYWRIEYGMVYNKQTWDLKILDRGPRYLVGSPPVSTRFTKESVPPEPYVGLLNNVGGRLVAENAPTPADSLLKFIPFEIYEELEFKDFIRRRDGSAIT